MKEAFKAFMFVMFRQLGLTDPTDEQCELADYLQYGGDRIIVEAFRGWGKSQITGLYVLWCLYVDQQCRIMIVSGSAGRAKDMTQYLLKLIREINFLKFLAPRKDDRQSTEKFDVNGAEPSQSPSVKSVGITGQITGSRAHKIIADDVETPKNSMTEVQRSRTAELVREFDSVIFPAVGNQIIYLGTPQVFMSLYNILQTQRQFTCRVWPVEYPTAELLAWYGERLSVCLREKLQADPKLAGTPIEPKRFGSELIAKKKASGRTWFSLQYMLCTRSSDELRFPLRLSDLIVMETDCDSGPEKPIWAASPELCINDLPNVGMDGDRYYRPMRVQGDYLPYHKKVMVIDPSGRGKDETTFAVGGVLNGYVYLLDESGYLGGYCDETLEALAKVAARWKVHEVVIEDNYGDGMFTKMIKPFFHRIYPVTVTGKKVKGQKEVRIIDCLEPVLNQHRLVVSPTLIKKDFESVQGRDEDVAPSYMLFTQLTQITRDPQSLTHDDRLDALAQLVAEFNPHMDRDADISIEKHRQKALRETLREFMRSAGRKLSSNNRSWHRLDHPKKTKGPS